MRVKKRFHMQRISGCISRRRKRQTFKWTDSNHSGQHPQVTWLNYLLLRHGNPVRAYENKRGQNNRSGPSLNTSKEDGLWYIHEWTILNNFSHQAIPSSTLTSSGRITVLLSEDYIKSDNRLYKTRIKKIKNVVSNRHTCARARTQTHALMHEQDLYTCNVLN